MPKKISKKQPIKRLLFMIGVLFFVLQPFGFLNALAEINCSSESLLKIKKADLERCKSIEEIRKLKSENDRSLIVTFTPYVTSLIALFSLIFNYQKEKKAQRDKDTKDKERQLDEQYNSIVVGLGEESLSLQASNASALLNFLQPNHLRFLDDILTIVSVNLKKSVCREPAIQESLTRVLEKAIRIKLNEIKSVNSNKPCLKHLKLNLNLSRTALFRLNFQNLDFSGVNVDIAFAKMRYANLNNSKIPKLRGMKACLYKAEISRCDLTEARLNKARCREAKFHNSILVSATFKEADLRGAEFHQARLQSAHFEGARLQGANFTAANLTDAYFKGAKLDDYSKKTILKSYKESWKRANFDDDIKTELYSLEKSLNFSETNIHNS
jgi:uncharacterized protein YjbI with pentapeptide repeats